MIKYLLAFVLLFECFPIFGDNVLIYSDEGVDKVCLRWVTSFFESKGDDVRNVDAEFLIKHDEEWKTQYDKIVIPGGADCPYHKKLKGQGCDNIKKFVNDGGTYIGICAGGYFGSKKVEFGLGTDLEVNEDRELAFFPGIARGPMLKPYVYDSEDGASAAKIRSSEGSIFYSYHNGGSTFILDGVNKSKVEILAVYVDENNAPAVIRCKYGKGQAILSGIHFEADQEKLLGCALPTDDAAKVKLIADKVESTSEIKDHFFRLIL